MKKILLFSLLSWFLFSCGSRKDIVYFQSERTISEELNQLNSTLIIKPGEKLSIMITAEDPRVIQPFNHMGGADEKMTGLSYTVDKDGFILFPKLGKIKIGGLTRVEVVNLIGEELGKYIVDPGVIVNIESFQITVIGEVNSPGVYSVDKDHITILEALGLAKDLTIQGVRKNVMVIRKEGNVSQEYRLDLTSPDLFRSPVYYLAQNDVVYVEPNKTKINTSKASQNNTMMISLVSVLLSFYAIILK